ncbi:hypothetical protein CEUSTIGMA_g12684.t1 [Chlamydomonas eustigma]|uniref:J domain-containing protein n=1 Tax=Chlamydomonas eustigma TaxID=1157962 RepID=A0A250XQC9_9CHLO|nr:hypothetical protein CEUSTIGMA_g12684.t1 [Chlamydomonas eustigma]|eukprot:GAX85265.1 hypothetical protein CEUSTIGMA_g12684.t1 [Chlamydomonas eustigma]
MDPYNILGISMDANQSVIKSAYRKMALKYHPDKNPDSKATEEFTRITDAYESIMSRFTERAEPNLEDLLARVFGISALRRGRPTPKLAVVEVDLAMVRDGGVVNVQLDSTEQPCPSCDGLGGKLDPCRNCGGRGLTIVQLGSMMIGQSTCQPCGGIGGHVMPGQECTECKGRRFFHAHISFKLQVPAGLPNGYKQVFDKYGTVVEFRYVNLQGIIVDKKGNVIVKVQVTPKEASEATNSAALAVFVYFTAKLSGGHLNPALTLAFGLLGYVNPFEVIIYWFAQISGSIFGAVLIGSLVPGIWDKGSLSSDLAGCFEPSTGVSKYQVLGWEAICTFSFLLPVFSVVWYTQDKNGYGNTGPIIVGLSSYAASSAAASWTGGVLNPARVIASSIVFGSTNCGLTVTNAIYYVGGELLAAVCVPIAVAPWYGISGGSPETPEGSMFSDSRSIPEAAYTCTPLPRLRRSRNFSENRTTSINNETVSVDTVAELAHGNTIV